MIQGLKHRLLLLPIRLHQGGWPRLGEKVCNFFLQLKPDHPELLNQLTTILAETDRSGAAVRLMHQAIGRSPDNPYLYSVMGKIMAVCNRGEDAADNFRKAITLKPELIGSRLGLANQLGKLGHFDEAIACFGKIIEQKPRLNSAYYGLGNVYLRMENAKLAADCFKKALLLDGEHVDSYVCLGRALIELGHFDEARKILLQGLTLSPNKIEMAKHLTLLATDGKADKHLDNMERLLDGGVFSAGEQITLLFSLAKGYMGQGDYERGFAYLHRGNQLHRSGYLYNIDQDSALFRRIIQTFDSDLFDKFAGCGSASRLPVFILGMPRSGTTLVEQILASHSEVFGAGELGYIGDMANDLARLSKSRMGFPEGVADLEPEEWQNLALGYENSLRGRAEHIAYITDKMPHNFLLIGIIHLLFPNALIIHCRRDPVDTCMSCYMQYFSGAHPYAYDLTELGRYYQLYAGLMNHWREMLPDRLLEVQYEHLVADPQGVGKKIVAGCGLEWQEECLDFHKSQRPVYTSSVVQVRQPIYRSAVGRWLKHEEHLQPLLAALGPLVTTRQKPDLG